MQTVVFFLLLLALPLTYILATNVLPSAENGKVVILLGAPASGKGTQAVRLAKKLNIPHISTGDLFRENISKKTPLGEEAKSYIEAGKLVPDDVVLRMVYERLSLPDAKNGYLLDGFPRTIAQADALGSKIPPNFKVIVLNLDVKDETIIERALGRGRSDDTREVVAERLKNYHNQTAPLVEYYTKKGILKNINGEKTPDEVFKSLEEAL